MRKINLFRAAAVIISKRLIMQTNPRNKYYIIPKPSEVPNQAAATSLHQDCYTNAQQLQYSSYLNKLRDEFEKKWSDKPVYDIAMKDLDPVKTLGQGAFGRVILLKHNNTSKYYAMKVLEKEKIVKMKQIEHTLYEKRVLECISFPFVVNMEFAFKDNCNIYFVMPFITGGEMFTHLRKLGKFEESLAKFYASQVILALEYLHHCNLVYRDLKPENILIEKNGYLKITDFGFCKVVKGRTWTLCGTPEYLAPEIILSKGYGKSVDWWSFGILLFEMNAGYPPFFAGDPMKIYEKIVAGKFRSPSHFSPELRGLVKSVIQVDITRRYGVLKDGVMDLKGHRWFVGVDWDGTLNCKVKPQYTPKYKTPGDTSNFDTASSEQGIRASSRCRYEEEFRDF